MSAHLTADQKPDLLALQDESQPSLPKLNNFTKNKNKSPTKSKRAPTVKQEMTGTSPTKSSADGFNPTSRDMAYHHVMIALEKVTLETRKEIAERLNVRQKNLDASWSINWKKNVDKILHDAFCK